MINYKLNKKSILVVDDEYGIRDILGFYFKDEGWEVTTASDGNEAYKFISESAFDIVLSDIQMPGCDGVELLQKIKSETPLASVILMTGFSDYDQAELIDMGAEKVFKKPFSLEQLTEEIFKVYKDKVHLLQKDAA